MVWNANKVSENMAGADSPCRLFMHLFGEHRFGELLALTNVELCDLYIAELGRATAFVSAARKTQMIAALNILRDTSRIEAPGFPGSWRLDRLVREPWKHAHPMTDSSAMYLKRLGLYIPYNHLCIDFQLAVHYYLGFAFKVGNTSKTALEILGNWKLKRLFTKKSVDKVPNPDYEGDPQTWEKTCIVVGKDTGLMRVMYNGFLPDEDPENVSLPSLTPDYAAIAANWDGYLNRVLSTGGGCACGDDVSIRRNRSCWDGADCQDCGHLYHYCDIDDTPYNDPCP